MSVNKADFVEVMNELTKKLGENHPDSSMAQYFLEMNDEIKKAEGVAFTGQVQVLFDHVPMIKMSDDLTFTEEECDLWRKLTAMNQLGNNLFRL